MRASGGLSNGSAGVRVTLRWQWAPEAIATLIVARQGAPPQGPSDRLAVTATVFRYDYDRHDCWTLTLPSSRPDQAGGQALPRPDHEPNAGLAQAESGPWYIRVYSIAELDGVTSVSPGLDPTASTTLPGPHPEVTVSYVLKRPWLPLLPWSVTFRTDLPGTAVPPMVLVVHPRTVPLSVEDGKIVARFPAGHDGAVFPIRASVKLSHCGARIFPDPSAPPDTVTPIRLRHPETGATRV
jgi:hypothetical protein